MKKLSFLLLAASLFAASLLACSPAFAQDARAVAEARSATERWLDLMDAEEYSAAWKSSSGGMRDGMPKVAWTMLATATHAPLGTFKSRRFKGFSAKKSSSETPREAIDFVYEARYEKNAHVEETVTAVHEKDGAWRVSGFNISDEK